MENRQLGCNEVVVEIPGGDHKKSYSIDPLTPASNNIEVVQLDQANHGLRSRKKLSPCTDSSSGIEIPTTNLIPTPQQVDVVQKPKPGPTESSDEPSAWKLENDEVSIPTSAPQIELPTVGTGGYKVYYKVRIKHLLILLCIIIVLILSKTIHKLKNMEIWIFELWEWCVLLLAIICGRFVSSTCMIAILLFIQNHIHFGNKVRYVIPSLQKSIGVFIWLGLILVTWELVINRGVRKSRGTHKVVVMYITRGVTSTFVVAGLWVPRTLLVKIINSSIYARRYVDRIPEDIIQYYILQTLSGPSLNGGSESINGCKSPSRRSSFTKEEGEQKKGTILDVLRHLHLNHNRISLWTIDSIIKAVMESEFPHTYDENAADTIFRNVAKPGQMYITKDDFLRFMEEVDAESMLPVIGRYNEAICITNKSFVNWVKGVSWNHKALACSIDDTKSAIKELNKFVTVFTVALYLIIWLIIMKIATREVLLFISSQFLLAIFTFGASAKSTVEAIIFVFVKYPYETGDRCLVDGVQVVVEEVNILTTVFLKYDNEKIYYPNSELASKPISNFNRSPDMGDFVDFDLDVSTSNEIISVLTANIKGYIDNKPDFWHPDHNIRVLEIQDLNKMKMRLCVTHTINFQSYGKRNQRISELVKELKKFFEELGIKYHYLSPRRLHDGTF